VVVVEGFYEWREEDKRGAAAFSKGGKTYKQPYFVHGKSGGVPLYMAGLYDVWEGGVNGPMHSYTILTTEVSKQLDWLHDRMPVLLPTSAAVTQWLAAGQDGGGKQESALEELFRPYEGLAWHPVGTAVNKLGHESPDCTKEVSLGPKPKATLHAFFGGSHGRWTYLDAAQYI
jgi:putative SOS response-associated peptidase YedK